MKTALALPLLALSACSAGPSAPESYLAAQAVRRGEENGLQVWVFELTNRSPEVILLLDVQFGYGGKLKSVGAGDTKFEQMAHACEEGRSVLSPGDTLHYVRREERRAEPLEFRAVYRRQGWQDAFEVAAKADLK